MTRAHLYWLTGGLVFTGGLAYVATRAAKKPDTSGGLVPDDPAELARAAGVPLDVYALARCIASEHGRDNETIQTAVGWAVLNEANRRGKSVSALLLAPQGRFGSQSAGKYASTKIAPNKTHLAIATGVLTGMRPDSTGGATQFDSPRAQRALLARGTPGYTKTPEQVAAARIAAGSELVVIPGVDPDYLRFWRKVRA